MYVANRQGTRISKVTVDHEFITEFGQGQFTWLTSVALDREENVYTADEYWNLITVFDKDGNLLKSWGETGADAGQLWGPSGMAFDTEDNVWVVNSQNSRIQKFTKDGQYLGGFGSKGSGPDELDMPWGITIDGKGDIYVADWNNHRVQKFSPDGTHLLTFGSGQRTGVSPEGGTPYAHTFVANIGVSANSLNHPASVAVDGDGDVYVVDWMNERVVIFDDKATPITYLRGDAEGLSPWAQLSIAANPDMGKRRRQVKNPEIQNYLRMPVGCAFDRETNRLIVCDTMRGRLQIYEKDKSYVDPQFNL
jgi:sugar lactone lactonase YvrE